MTSRLNTTSLHAALSLLIVLAVGCASVDQLGEMERRHADHPGDVPAVDFADQPAPSWTRPPLPATTDDGILPLSLEQAVMLTLQGNRSLTVERYRPVIDGAFEQIERGVFDPEVFAEGRFFEETASETSRSTGERFSVEGEDLDAEVGLRQRLPTGADLEASVAYARAASDRAPEQQEARLGLSITQSLLNGFGPAVNLVDIRQAELDTQASLFELRGFVEALVAETEQAYWNYVLAREEKDIVERSRAIAQQQLEEVEQRIDVGVQPRNAAAAARAELARRQQALIEATSLAEDRRLRLLRLTNVGREDAFELPVAPTSRPETPSAPLTDLAERIALADHLRPDLNESRLRLEQRRLDVVRTRNGLLPKLDLFINLGKTGYAESFSDAVSNVDEDSYDLAAGIRFSAYLGNRDARGRDLAARAEQEQAAAAVENLRNLIELDVRLALNDCERTRQQIDAGATTVEWQRQTLDAERERFSAGDSTSLQVAQAQRDFLASELSYVSSIVNYRIALVDLYLAEGSLLERRGIQLGTP